jgi:FAD/FMN-containing dehydrogenase/Fe-S oxidoreductase
MGRTELPLLGSKSQEPSMIDVAGLRAALLDSVAGEVRFDRLSRALYSTDASVYQIVPLGVVFPMSEEDILATLAACRRFRVPLTARGGGTSQAGQCIGPGVVLDCSRHLNAVLEINEDERWARVEPGCVLDDLNQAARPLGLQFAPDISTSNRATIAGMIANNSSGTHSLIHGKTIDHVLELRAALADGSVVHCHALGESELKSRCSRDDLSGRCHRVVRDLAEQHKGEIDRRYPKILRRVGGYNLDRFVDGSPFNLANLLVGSEGTLAVTLEAKLKLIKLPRARAILVIQFAEFLDALAATPLILTHHPAAVEVIDRYVLDSTKLNPEASRLRDFLKGDPGAILIVEFYSEEPSELPTRLKNLEAGLRGSGHGGHFHEATEGAAQGRIWKLRKLALGLSMAEKGDAKAISFVEDSAVAPESLRDYIAEFLDVIHRHGTKAGVYAHASVGCLHVRPVINLKTVEGVRQFEAIAAEVADLVLKYGGALSGEHGDGLVRSPFQEKMFGPTLYEAFRTIKRTFDPENILNPDKIVDAPPLAANLRYGPAYVTPAIATTFDFSADGGMIRAAELCAGVGECRKRGDGIMCPSYQATREETHSTRGRANVLRLVMTGQLGSRGILEPEVREALDLCLECKACKSECPTNVDMARLKAEVLDRIRQQRGLPWRSWLFANVASLAHLGSRFPRLANWLTRGEPGRWLQDKLLGIDRRRIPPPLVGRNDLRRLQFLVQPGARNDARILLFPDTFASYFEPAIGLAALKVLHHCGVAARTASEVRCCGRPHISNGLLSQAAEHARYNVNQLYSWAAAGKHITACEPSCLLTIKDDYPALLRGDERRKAEVVAGACKTFEEVLDDEAPDLTGRYLDGPRRILVHGHCHQRSLVGMEPTLRVLRRLTGAEVIALEAGCCGMAGSFGYEKEHYELSRLVGEQRLFPALRQEWWKGTDLVASGFSCRQQIQHFTGRAPLHTAELLLPLFAGRGV